MAAKRGIRWGLVAALCAGLSGATAAQKNAKPSSQSREGTLTFGCSNFGCGGIIGEDPTYQGIGVPETGEGAHLTAPPGNELWLGFGSGKYKLTFYVASPFDGPPCQTGLTPCRYLFGPQFTIDNENGEFQSNVLSPTTGQPTANGLLDIGDGQTWRSWLRISFGDPMGRNLLWGLNFNPDYPDATPINVRRTSPCTWDFCPGAGDRAGLSAYGSGATKGKAVRTNEGLYDVPFSMTFIVPSLCP